MSESEPMRKSDPGQVITFYSYKGGTGRTMALANVAWILASAGHRVLAVDWDIEAPGLPRFFEPFLPRDPVFATGVIDMVRTYVREAAQQEEGTPVQDREATFRELTPDPHFPRERIAELARVDDHAFSISWAFPAGGSLSLLTAGLQNDQYASTLGSMDWDRFYEDFHGGAFFDALRRNMRASYDYVLIDSRTGFSDVADICTQHLPDVLVDCYTLSDQGIQGAARVAQAVARFGRSHGEPDGPDHPIRIYPVAMRVDPFEQVKVEAGRALARRSFPDLPSGLSSEERLAYFAEVEIPYRTYYAFEETLATFEGPGTAFLLSAYERLTSVITGGRVREMPRLEETVRLQWLERFRRPVRSDAASLIINYAAADQVWAEWVLRVLEDSDIRVRVIDPGPVELARADALAGRPDSPRADLLAEAANADVVSIVSHHLSAAQPVGSGHRTDVALYIGEARLPERPRSTAHFSGVRQPTEARRRLLEAVGFPGAAEKAIEGAGARYPGVGPAQFANPPLNPQFSGRLTDLDRLRSALRESDGRAVVLEGMAGIGKTYLATEYVQRFAAAYDLVWWIQADPPQFVDTGLADLGRGLGLNPDSAQVDDVARSVLDALRSGRAGRWLLVFDNAIAVEQIARFLPGPQSGGHVLITSWNPDWGSDGRAEPLTVGAFPRQDSIAHLLSRVPGLEHEDADELAAALDDLPMLVNTNASLLADSGMAAGELIQRLHREGPPTPEAGLQSLIPALEMLGNSSAGAYRLLELLSVLGPETALDLVTSNAMAEAILPVDPSVSDPMMRNVLIQRISKLSLVRLDREVRHLFAHQLVQQVVRSRMSEKELGERRHQAHLILAGARPEGDPDDPGTWPRFRNLWPHLEACRVLECNDEPVRQLLVDRVRYLWARGDPEQGLNLGTRVSERWERVLKEGQGGKGPEVLTPEGLRALNRQLLHLRFNLGNILRQQAKFEEALASDREVLEAQAELLGDKHWHYLLTLGGLAADLRAVGSYEEALIQSENAYRTWGEIFGEDNQRTLSAANNVAVSLRLSGNFRRAAEIDTDVLRRRQFLLGDQHPATLSSASSLARDLREAGDYERSVEVLQQALRIDRLLPTARIPIEGESPVRLSALANMAASMRSAGRPDESEPILTAVRARFTQQYGLSAPDTLATRVNHAANLLARGRAEAALQEFTDLTDAYSRWLGADHLLTLISNNNRSAALWELGRPNEAKQIAAEVSSDSSRLLGRDHPFALAAHMNSLTCTFEVSKRQFRPDLAAQLQDLTEQMRRTLDDDHPDTLALLVNQALMRSPKNDRGELQEAVKALADRLRPDHPSVITASAGKLIYRVIDPPDVY